MSDLTTIVVNWNTADLLDDCLASIAAATPEGLANEVILVDNGSRDDSVARVRGGWPEVRVIANDENVGFCRANNQAIRASDSPYLLLVNTDARLAPGSIATLLGHLERDERAAVVGPRLVYGDGAFQRWTAGRLPTVASLGVFLLGLDRIAPGSLGRGSLYLARDRDRAFRPEWVSSAVMAVRRAALDEVGLLDESIFVYMDDVDLCARAVAAGWHVWYAPETTATHFMGASSKRVTGRPNPEAIRALNRWHARRHGPAAGRLVQALEFAGFGGRAAIHGLAGALGRPGSRDAARAHLSNLRLVKETTA